MIAQTLLNEEDPVCIEDPAYPGARSAFLAVGAKVLPVSVDDEGMDVINSVQHRRPPKLIYVTPSHQFPLGVTMSLGRRMSLLDWAEKSPAFVIEDDYDSEFRFVIDGPAYTKGHKGQGQSTATSSSPNPKPLQRTLREGAR